MLYKLAVALVPHTLKESILLSNVFSFFPLIINLVFPRLTFIPLLSNASLHSSKFSLNFYIVSPIWTKRLHKEFDSSNLSLHFPLLHLSPWQTTKATTPILGVHQLSQKILTTSPIQLEVSFLLLHKDSLPP